MGRYSQSLGPWRGEASCQSNRQHSLQTNLKAHAPVLSASVLLDGDSGGDDGAPCSSVRRVNASRGVVELGPLEVASVAQICPLEASPFASRV